MYNKPTTVREAASTVRDLANAIIEQRTRWANGWDRQPHGYRDDCRVVDRAWARKPAQAVEADAAAAFAIAITFA